MADYRAFVHLGAHRTGSSSFQLFLGHNKARLEQAGYSLFYPARDGAPGGYRKKIQLPPPYLGDKAQKQLFHSYIKPLRDRVSKQLRPDRPKIILSEENILGRMIYFFSGGFYPGVEHRTRAAFKGLGHPVDTVTLVIRNYADVFASAYTMYAQTRLRSEFSALSDQLVNVKTGWPELIDRISAGGGFGRLIVVPYESRGSDKNLLRLVCGEAMDDLQAVPERQNISASTEAIAEIQRRFAAGEALTKARKSEIIAAHAIEKGNSKFAPFAAKDKKRLTDRYRREIDVLAKRKDITLVTA